MTTAFLTFSQAFCFCLPVSTCDDALTEGRWPSFITSIHILQSCGEGLAIDTPRCGNYTTNNTVRSPSAVVEGCGLQYQQSLHNCLSFFIVSLQNLAILDRCPASPLGSTLLPWPSPNTRRALHKAIGAYETPPLNFSSHSYNRESRILARNTIRPSNLRTCHPMPQSTPLSL